MAQPVSLAKLKLARLFTVRKCMGDVPGERPKQLTLPSFGREVKLRVPYLDAAFTVSGGP